MLLRAISTRLLNRHVASRLTRVIPHPGVRTAVMLASTFIVPMVVEALFARARIRVRASALRRIV